MSDTWICNDCGIERTEPTYGFKNICDQCKKPLCHYCAEACLRDRPDGHTETCCPKCEKKEVYGPTAEELEAEGQQTLFDSQIERLGVE